MQFLLVLITLFIFPNQVLGQPIQVSIESDVNEKGQVALALTLKNTSSQSVFHIHPMFHFHHSMAMMTAIRELRPGQSITLENDKHPSVLRVGNYPITAMVKYKVQLGGGETKMVLHTDSFYFKEAVQSQVEGSINSSGGAESSILKIMLKNQSDSLKNIRMMLLLPPGIVTENFKGMMGFTLRGSEEKTFEVTVQRNSNLDEDRFPVRLMVEYGEMLKHYSGEIKGVIQFSPSWYSVKYLQHFSILFVMGLLIIGLYIKFHNTPLKKKGKTNA
ncbi:MAG: hypothetical protein H8E32_03915 [Nitrospinae bacterium]|nr:hypothetical protein [Nitrospinota bacterium]